MYFDNKQQDSFNWVQKNSRLEHLMNHNLNNISEVPHFLYGYAPGAAKAISDFWSTKMLPSSENYILHKEKGLLCREASFMRQRLDRASKINIFDIAETSGDSSLPFIFELLENDMLGLYVPVTPNAKINETAIFNLQTFAHQALLPKFNTDKILVDVEMSDFGVMVQDITSEIEGDDYLNLFLLAGSRLGNSHSPETMLRNIYNSMNQGDHLVIIQGIYRKGTEDMIIADYNALAVNNLDICKEIAAEFNPDRENKMNWDDSGLDPVIKFTTKFKTNNSKFKLEKNIDDEIILFRSTRFKEENLRNMITGLGFDIVNISYDKFMDHALFFLEK